MVAAFFAATLFTPVPAVTALNKEGPLSPRSETAATLGDDYNLGRAQGNEPATTQMCFPRRFPRLGYNRPSGNA
jgi:hypothetical protein